MNNLRPPEPLSLGIDQAQEWSRWIKNFKIYAIATELKKKPIIQQRAILLNIMGEKGIEIYETLNICETEEAPKLNEVIERFDQHFKPLKNTTFKRHEFFTAKQTEMQTFAEYVTELKIKSNDCEFGELKDSLIRDKIILGLKDMSLKEKLLQEPNLTLARTIDLGKAAEASQAQIKKINKEETQLDTVSAKMPGDRRPTRRQQEAKSEPQRRPEKRACKYCGNMHKPRSCPAYGKYCNNCHKSNHFASVCNSRSVNTVDEDDDRSSVNLNHLSINILKDEWNQTIMVNGNRMNFKLDTGAQANVIPWEIMKKWSSKPHIEKANVAVYSYTGAKVPLKGQCMLECRFKDKNAILKFLITNIAAPPILGLDGCQKLNLIAKVESIIKDRNQDSDK